MTEQNKRKRNTEKINQLYLDTNPENTCEPQMTTTISSINYVKPKKETRNNSEKKNFHITFNRTLKSKDQIKKYSKTQNGL